MSESLTRIILARSMPTIVGFDPKIIKHLCPVMQACVTIVYSFVNLVETLNFISHGTALSIRLADSSPATGRRNASRSRLNYI